MVLALLVFGLAGGTARAVTLDGQYLNASDGTLASTTMNLTFNNVASDLAQWGINPGTWSSNLNTSGWLPKTGITYVVQDYKPSSDSHGYVSPWGGGGDQPFDAEAMYFTYNNTLPTPTAYFAVVVGMPQGGSGGNNPGDLFLKIDGAPTWNFAFVTNTFDGHPANSYGKLYQISAGNIQNGTAFPSPPNAGGGASWITGGTDGFANTNFFYSAIDSTGHYLIEASAPMSTLNNLGPNVSLSMHWTQQCGNDAIDLTAQLPPGSPSPAIPEPATCTLLGGGLLAALVARHRRNARQAKGVKS